MMRPLAALLREVGHWERRVTILDERSAEAKIVGWEGKGREGKLWVGRLVAKTGALSLHVGTPFHSLSGNLCYI